jgi:uncharacterized repeat protein (TIGR01451 family)
VYRLICAFLLLVVALGDQASPTPTAQAAAPDVPLEVRFQGRDLYAPGGFLTGPAAGDPLDIALSYLRSHTAQLGLTADDLSDIVVQDRYVSQHNGVTHLYLRQRLRGIEVYNGDININVARDGRIVNLGNRFVRDLRRAANAAAPKLTPAEAVRRTADGLGLTVSDSLAPIAGRNRAAGQTLLGDGGFSRAPIPMELMYQPLDSGAVRLVWDMQIQPTVNQDWLSLRTDALTGKLLSQANWTTAEQFGPEFMTDAQEEMVAAASPAARATATNKMPLAAPAPNSYLVYPFPARDPDDSPRALVTDPADAQASPFGWHDTNGAAGAEHTTARGNNAHAYADLVAPDGFSAGDVEKDGGASLVFSSTLNLAQQPDSYRDASITNLFYWTNTIHDIFYHYGFDEASGNFQHNNYGRGGIGADYVKAEVQDYSGRNNANFSTPPDGNPGRMQMYIWDGPTTASLTITPPNSQLAVGVAAFGPASFDATANVILANDGASAPPDGTPTDGCESITNNLTGKIALIDRGTCNFTVKVANAQAAGAIGVLIADNRVAIVPPGLGGASPSITIPVLSITQSDGATIKSDLSNGPVTAHMVRAIQPGRDSSLDSGIIIHEYGHGISNRLTGGPSNSGCLSNAEQGGEGWSDFFALALTAKPGDTRVTNRPVGTYADSQPPTGAGIRRYPYTTDMAVNPETYDTLKVSGQVHAIGAIWAGMLWEVYWNLVDDHGFDPNISTGTGGNNRAIQLVIDGLKLQPCNPHFADARDAILAADLVNYGGVDQCLIWEGFAKRGLGYSADAGSNENTGDGTEAFDLPPACTVNPQPPTAEICVPANAIYQVAIGPSVSGALTLSISGQPAGATVTFSANPVAAPNSSTLTIGNTAAIPPGRYVFQVIGSGTQTYISPVTMHVASAAPSIPVTTLPAAGANDVALRPTLTWTEPTQAFSYTLQVATDAGFTNVVYSTTTQTTSHTLTRSLRSAGIYYWRVTAANGCGLKTSTAASFTVRTTPRILLVDDDGDAPDVRASYTSALDAIGAAYDIWDTKTDGEPESDTLASYATAIWFTGANGYPGQAAELALAGFLDDHSCLFVSSQEYFFNRGLTPFMQSYLGVASATDDSKETTVTGAGPVFGGLGPYTLALPYDNHTDAITPTASAVLAFSGNNGTATVNSAVQKDAGGYRTSYWGFDFAGLPDAAARQEAMRRVVSWCEFQADLDITQTVTPAGVLKPGQPLTYTLAFTNSGVVTATNVLITDTLPTQLTSLNVAGSGPAIAQLPGTPYRWQVADLAPGASGSITISGKARADLTGDVSTINKAMIGTSTVESDTTDNSAQAQLSVTVPRVRFSGASYSVVESGGNATITVALNEPNPYAATTVAYATSNGSAQAGSDYTARNGTLTIPAGQTSASFSLPIADDTTSEGAETVLLGLSSPLGAALGAPSSATLTILANDGGGLQRRIYLPLVRR